MIQSASHALVEHIFALGAKKCGKQEKHKNPDFVLEIPENGGSKGQKRTKMPILFSERQGLASGSATVAFLQITAHASKTQMPYIQVINFCNLAR